LSYESTEEWDLADERYRRIIAKNPNHATALNNLAYLLAVRKGKAAEALPFADRAYRTSIADPAMADTLALIYYLLDKSPLAEPIIVIAARQRPDIAEIRLHAALILAKTGKTTLAKQHLDAAVRLDPALEERTDVKDLRARLRPAK
jgi:cellulose synthase operon protein C